MQSFTQSIKFKIVLAFGICVALMVLIGTFGMYGLSKGVQPAGEVGATTAEVKQSIRQVSDIVGEIAAASEEQSRGIEQVNQAVGQMDKVTQQNAALVEQAAAAAQSLEEQAMNLTSAVSVFKVGPLVP